MRHSSGGFQDTQHPALDKLYQTTTLEETEKKPVSFSEHREQ